jgi:hypothetical protein
LQFANGTFGRNKFSFPAFARPSFVREKRLRIDSRRMAKPLIIQDSEELDGVERDERDEIRQKVAKFIDFLARNFFPFFTSFHFQLLRRQKKGFETHCETFRCFHARLS